MGQPLSLPWPLPMQCAPYSVLTYGVPSLVLRISFWSEEKGPKVLGGRGPNFAGALQFPLWSLLSTSQFQSHPPKSPKPPAAHLLSFSPASLSRHPLRLLRRLTLSSSFSLLTLSIGSFFHDLATLVIHRISVNLTQSVWHERSNKE